MPTKSEPMDPWTSGSQILGINKELIGRVRVAGLDQVERVLNAPKGTRLRFPDLIIAPIDRETIRWFIDWTNEPRGGSFYRDLLIRDNDRRSWFLLKGAWLQEYGRVEDGCNIVIHDASLETFETDLPAPGSLLGIG